MEAASGAIDRNCTTALTKSAYQGDGHPTMATAASVFGSAPTYALIRSALELTDTGCDGCGGRAPTFGGSYPLYWTLSLAEYFMASGDAEGFLSMAPDAASILDKQFPGYNQSFPDIGFMGWDDRVGNGGGLGAGGTTVTLTAIQ
jgi:hypothetical protein